MLSPTSDTLKEHMSQAFYRQVRYQQLHYDKEYTTLTMTCCVFSEVIAE